MSGRDFDLGGYLTRIGHRGRREPGAASHRRGAHRNNTVREHNRGRTVQREMRDAEDFRTTVADAFGLALPDDQPALLMGALDERAASGAPHAFFA